MFDLAKQAEDEWLAIHIQQSRTNSKFIEYNLPSNKGNFTETVAAVNESWSLWLTSVSHVWQKLISLIATVTNSGYQENPLYDPQSPKLSLGPCNAFNLALCTGRKHHTVATAVSRNQGIWFVSFKCDWLNHIAASQTPCCWGSMSDWLWTWWSWFLVPDGLLLGSVFQTEPPSLEFTGRETKEGKYSVSFSELQSYWGKCLVDARGQRSQQKLNNRWFQMMTAEQLLWTHKHTWASLITPLLTLYNQLDLFARCILLVCMSCKHASILIVLWNGAVSFVSKV